MRKVLFHRRTFGGLIVALFAVILTGSAEHQSYAPDMWVNERIALLEESIGAPMPSSVEDLMDFAGISGDVDKENYCMAQAIYFEARSEPIEGQIAVATVVMNRVVDPRYPDTICGVVFQNERWMDRCQFSFACDGEPDEPREAHAWMMSKRIANLVQTNWLPDTTEAATHYHATYVRPYWSDKLDRTKRVGRHIFYREELSAAFRDSIGEADLAQDTVVREDLAQ